MSYESGTVADVTITAGDIQTTFRGIVYVLPRNGMSYWMLSNGTTLREDDARIKDVHKLQVLSTPKVNQLPDLLALLKDSQDTWASLRSFIEKYTPKPADTPWSTVTDKPEEPKYTDDQFSGGAIVVSCYGNAYQKSLSGLWFDEDDDDTSWLDIAPNIRNVVSYGVPE